MNNTMIGTRTSAAVGNRMKPDIASVLYKRKSSKPCAKCGKKPCVCNDGKGGCGKKR